jgi:opacity protein-like surface antigen
MRVRSFSSIAATAIIAASTGLLAALPAGAADLPAPPKVVYDPAPPVAIGGGWYLRGDIGVTQQQFRKLTHAELDLLPHTWIDKGHFKPAAVIGIGAGYQFNSWFRADVTGEYRTKSTLRAIDSFPINAPPLGANTNYFTVDKEEWVGLANAYLDLGTWGGLTPYVGAGLGFATIRVSNFRDYNVGSNFAATAPTGTRTNFAWALHAGFGYQFSDRWMMDVSYRYLNMGNGQTGGPPRAPGAANTTTQPWVLRNIHSHDVRIGMRWLLDAPARTAYHDPAPRVVKY